MTRLDTIQWNQADFGSYIIKKSFGLICVINEYANFDIICSARYDSVIYDLAPQPAGKKEPVKVIEKIIGVELPDDIVMKIIDGVKAKLTIDNVSKVADTFKGMFK